MADTAIALANLQAAITASLTDAGTFTLDAAYLAAGLNDPDVAVSADFDTILGKAFQVSATAFSVAGSASGVSPVADAQFTVKGVTVPIIGGTETAPAALLFTTMADPSGDAVLVVQVASFPANWNWPTSFPYTNGFPFDQVPLTNTKLYFSTASGVYPWTATDGIAVSAGATQTLQASISFPDAASPYLALFAGLIAPTNAITLSGTLDLTLYGGPDFTTGAVLPVGTFTSVLSDEHYTFADYLSVSQPALALIIPAPDTADLTDGNGTQTPSLALTTNLLIGDAAADAYQLQVSIPSSAVGGDANTYTVSLVPLTTALLDPSDAITLIGGKGSYFDGTPAYLQQFLTSFGLTGMTLSGTFDLSSVTVSQATVQLGTPTGQNMNWQPLPAPTPDFSFTINSMALDWAASNPLDNPSFSYLFATSFSILPTVFKSTDGSTDGVFDVTFTSDQVFNASFDGSASLIDFLSTVSNGLVPSPTTIGVDIVVSDISLQLDYSSYTFAFSSAVDVDFSFLTIGDSDIFTISGGMVNLSAYSASSTSGDDAEIGAGTVWSGSFSGLVTLCDVGVNVTVSYDGAGDQAGWTLSAALTDTVDVSSLISQFFLTSTPYSFPSFLLGDLEVTALSAECFVPDAKDGANTYTISTNFDWNFSFGDQNVAIKDAAITVSYDGENFSGDATATWVYSAINLSLDFGYNFDEEGNENLYVTWEGFTATYASTTEGETAQQTITFTLKGWSVGTLISSLMATLGNPYFTLPSPWDLLDQISLDGLSITVSLEDGATNCLTGTYTLSTPLYLGFITIKGLSLTRNTAGEVRLSIDGTVPDSLKDSMGTLMEPEGQSVEDMPTVPGQGSEFFQLNLLALGQRIAISGYDSFTSTQEVITALEGVPETTGTQNPIVPTQSAVTGTPYYNADSDWLIALDFDLLKTGDTWAISLQIVFNDPDLYGMRLALTGGKTGALSGFVIDILYKKISDDIGLFQVNFTFPDSIRNLDFGAVSVVLPSIGVQIYTNGDFTIDLGFPYNMDFTQSFSISAIVFGVPVLGSGGLYFGKLSNATATQVPETQLGTFNPVIVFGLGLQVGLGYNFSEGPLSAGFALTQFGIIQGVIATYHPYDDSSSGTATTVQDTNYFYLQGTVGLIGMLYGTVDFQIITASVSVNITLSVNMTYESFEPIYINASASVKVSVKVKINLGLFSIKVTMSYHTVASVSFVINLPGQGTAPWIDSGQSVQNTALLSDDLVRTNARSGRLQRRRAWHRRSLPTEVLRRSPHLYVRSPKASRLAASVSKQTLTLVVAPQFTVLAPEGATSYADQQGAFVCQFAMDAPDPTNAADNTAEALGTSFEMMCASFFPWLIDLMDGDTAADIDLAATASQTVTLDRLQADMDWFANSGQSAFTTTDLLTFLSDAFILNIVTTPLSDETNHILFPLFDGFVLTIPDPDDSTNSKTVTLETYTEATLAYCNTVAAQLRQAAPSTTTSSSTTRNTADDTIQSMASFVLIDVFTIIARALLQAGINAFGSYAYTVAATDSIDVILSTFNNYGNAITTDDIVVPNADYDLNSGLSLSLVGLSSVIQASDTLTTIADRYSDPDIQDSRWSITAADLISVANGDARILQAGVTLTLTISGKAVPYTTPPGASFNQIAADNGITLSELSAQTSLYDLAGLLTPTTVIAIPDIAYISASGDTLNSIAATFGTTASVVGFDNADVTGLFVVGEIAIANLEALPISQVWTGITATSDIAQVGGQVASFLTAGLRLPMADGLTLSSDFLYPTQQSDYALFQLTGQQFPTPAPAQQQQAGYGITLGCTSQSHGVDMSFVTFNGSSTATSIDVDLSDAYGLLTTVLEYAQAGKFVPSPTSANVPLVLLQPRQYTNAGYAMWSTSDFATLAKLTEAGADAVKATPYLWSLPQSLINALQNQQATLSTLFDAEDAADYTNIIDLMPVYQPQIGTTSPNDPATLFSDLTAYAYATRVDFQITRLSATTDASSDNQSTSTASANDSTIYQLVGPSSSDAQVLEYLLTAVSALGDGFISGLFVLYSAGGTNTTTLTGQADSAFLSFISQTNLSTQSNPSFSTALFRTSETTTPSTPPQGIANTPTEFITLLWEQSVVKGGGYYFYWEQLDSGSGLPAEIFDSSGTATLTLVVTLERDLTIKANNALTNFTNAFVTTENLDPLNDVVVLQSQDTAGSSAPTTAADTLTSLAALYSVGVGALAQSNKTKSLANASQIPISGLLHQLTAAETQGNTEAQILNTLATYYSVGAVKAMTAADITSQNAGVSVVTGATLVIPAITYQVNPTLNPGPGNTFQSMADYYGLAVEGIAVLASGVAGLFPAETMLTIDTLSQDTQATQPSDNLSFTLSRANLGTIDAPPANATQEELDSYAQITLFSLYNTLSAGLAENPYFNASALGLPFGPQDDSDTDDATEQASDAATVSADGTIVEGAPTQKTVKPARARRLSPRQSANARSQSLAVQSDTTDYQYTQVLGFSGTNTQGKPFALINPAPQNPVAGLPAADQNPYIGIGTYACVALRWQDLYGNITLTPFELVPSGYTGALNNAPTALRYTDRLLGLSSWPKTQATYLYSGTAGAPVLNLSLALDISTYDADGQAVDVAEQDLATYQNIYFQLNQDYTGLNVPGVTGNAVTMTVTNSLLAVPDQQLSDAEAQSIRNFVADCVVFLQNYVSKHTLGAAPQQTLALTVDIDAIASKNLIRLDVGLTFTRNATLVEPLIAGLPDGLSVTSPILPYANGSDATQSSSFTSFASALETCLQTDTWYMCTGAGLSPVTTGNSSQTDQLYAVRFGKIAGVGIYFDIAPNAGYYAPLPVATSLESGTVQLNIYATGGTSTTQSTTFTSIDMNLWFESCLSAIDKFLSATYAPPAFILDQINTNDGNVAVGKELDAVLAAKQALADAIAKTTAPILSSSAKDSVTLAAAQSAMEQQLLTTLAPAFTAGTVVVFGLSNVSGADGDDSGGPPRLYGQPMGISTADTSIDSNQNYSFSSASLPVPASPTTAPQLAFNVTTKNVDAQSYIALDLSYQITHMEFERTTVPGIQDYVDSQWLVFINPLATESLGSQDIPVLNRSLPVPPTVQTQTATASNADDGNTDTTKLTPAQLATWNYAFTYSYSAAAQDDTSITITLNASGASTTTASIDDTDPLFTALADFVTNYPTISADLDTYLVQINGQTTDETLISNATSAVVAFQSRVTAVATAYADQFGTNATALFSLADVTTPVAFDARLEADDAGNAIMCLRNITISGSTATYSATDGTISNGTVTLSAPVVYILPDDYTATPLNPPPAGVTLAYTYPATQNPDTTPALTYTEALAETGRTVAIPDLNVMVYKNAQAALLTQRNTILTPDDQVGTVSTNPEFLYQTPLVTFSDPILPRITWPSYALRQLNPTQGTTVTDYMAAFFADLFTGAAGQLRLGMAGGYSYSVAPTVPGLPVTYLPINLLQPVDITVDASTPPAAALEVAQQVNDWFSTNQPSTAGEAAMDFKLNLFSDLSNEQLLFVINELYFTTGT
ncbi:LysM repeat protein [Agrobacterium vitis]|nr:LysM repeat protein [Agrobacterium vitis]MBE1436369.1 LysM repeat protein [Agrobacterium vitis]